VVVTRQTQQCDVDVCMLSSHAWQPALLVGFSCQQLLFRSSKDPDKCKHSTCSYSLGYVMCALCSLLTHNCTACCCICCCSSGMQPMCIYRVTAVNPTVVQTGTFESTRCVRSGVLRLVLDRRIDIWVGITRVMMQCCTEQRLPWATVLHVLLHCTAASCK
jgi:hypothetical protein